MIRMHCFTAAILLTSLSTFAQIKKGDKFLRGSLNFNMNSSERERTFTTEENENWSYSVSPSFGYMISDDYAIGAGFTLQQWERNNTISGSNNTTTIQSMQYGGRMFAQRYFRLSRSFYFSGRGQLGYFYNEVIHKAGNSGNPTKSFYNVLSVNFRPGFSYFFNDHFAADLTVGSIGYHYSSSRTIFTFNSHEFNCNFGLTSLDVGMSWFF